MDAGRRCRSGLSAWWTDAVRTWHRRNTGSVGRSWTGVARDPRPEPEADVAVADIGERDANLRGDVDAAYRTKYGHYGATSSIDVTADAAGATWRWSGQVTSVKTDEPRRSASEA